MRRHTRPILILLLVTLVTTWGICPCTMARALGIKGDAAASTSEVADGAERPVAPPCCCKPMAPTSESDGEVPPQDECPCCKRGGWMRDLPPQAQDIELEVPAPTFLDLPVLVVAERTATSVVEVRYLPTGPPTHQRPHASPVGVVRLLS